MRCKEELEYLIRVLKKMHIQTLMLSEGKAVDRKIDFGLRGSLHREEEYERAFSGGRIWDRDNVIFKLTDEFQCRYLLLPLRDGEEKMLLSVGPYVSVEIMEGDLQAEARRRRLPAPLQAHLMEFYANVPYVRDQSVILALVSAFGEVVWGGGDAFEIVDVARELTGTPALSSEEENEWEEDLLPHMDFMEARYNFENELLDLIAQGHAQRAEMMLVSFARYSSEQRTADSLRNQKNYAVISNTLMRKAAERGGVHPVHLDRVSSEFAQKIERASTVDRCQELIIEMLHAYCRLVRKHSVRKYSPRIQKVVSRVDFELAGDLSLKAMARALNVNASYLSSLVKKELGMTLTEYVNRRRVEHAAFLLNTTRLPISTVGQRCGVQDDNYFTKIFKKHMGITPKQYRQESGRLLGRELAAEMDSEPSKDRPES